MKAALVSLALTGGFFCFYVCRWKIVKHWPEIINDELDHEKIKMNQTKRTIKAILIGIIVLPLIGVLYDAYSGFHVLRNSKSIYGIIAGLTVTAALAFAGEYVSEAINAKDKVSAPLYKRVFHLLILLASVGVVGFLYWIIFHYFEILKI